MNILECEDHVLLDCPKYRELRINIFRLYYCHWPTFHQFESLFSQISKRVQEKNATYMYHVHKLRNLANV